MELKYDINAKFYLEAIVLIVPLWNWNMVEEGDTYNGWSFNRTFMELKSKLNDLPLLPALLF